MKFEDSREFWYLLGLIQSDGSLSQNTRSRGKLQIELASRDEDILHKLAEIIPYNSTISQRTRDTNFKLGSKSSTLQIYSLDFRNLLLRYGMVYGKKSLNAEPPNNITYPVDHMRGLIDGDGSLGLTGQGFPFLSFVTVSENLASYYLDFLKIHLNICKTTSRNARDGAFNIMITKEDAQKMSKLLYEGSVISLNRKQSKHKIISSWERPHGMKKVFAKKWDLHSDEYILRHPVEDSMRVLKRTKSSIKNRCWRLKNRRTSSLV